MAADFNINLAKDLTSSQEERERFYNGMLVYLVACAVALVLVAFLSSVNVAKYLKNKREHKQLVQTAAAVSGLDVAAFKNPDQTYRELETYARQIATLKSVLSGRKPLLPVIHNLFSNLPTGVALQSLSTDKDKLTFGLVMPPVSSESGDPVRRLRTVWERNPDLMRHVQSLRALTSERRKINNVSVFYVEFECVLKK